MAKGEQLPAEQHMSDMRDISTEDQADLTPDQLAELFADLGLPDQIPAGGDLFETIRASAEKTERAKIAAVRSLIETGAYLHLLKAEVGHGNFAEAHGLDDRRVSEAMRYAAAYVCTPKHLRARLLGASKKKVLAVCSLDEETANLILASDQFDEMMALPRATLIAEIAKLRSGKVTAEAKRDEYEAKLIVANRKNGAQPVLTASDAWRRDVRIESAALADAAMLQIADLARMVSHVENGHSPTSGDEALQDKALCTALLLHLHAVADQAYHLYCEAQESLAMRASTDLLDVPMLPGPEADVIWSARERMVGQHHDGKKDREWFRSLYSVQGRGRPVEPSDGLKKRVKKG